MKTHAVCHFLLCALAPALSGQTQIPPAEPAAAASKSDAEQEKKAADAQAEAQPARQP